MPNRKTFPVATFRDRANYLLANRDLRLSKLEGDDITPEQAYRLAWASALEMVLMDTGNYHGFGYLDVDYEADPPTVPDTSRRIYYGR